jgi:hypothetical protein
MKVYTFVFAVGLLNLIIPFLGFPLVFKQYAFVTLGVVAILYALYVRAIIKEQEAGLSQPAQRSAPAQQAAPVRTIEEVVEMREVPEKIVMSDVKPRRRGRKPKVSAAVAQEDSYE